MRTVFSLGALLVLSYYLLWYTIRAVGWHWHTAWNIPGFLFLAGSMPWSLPVTANAVELANFLDRHIRDAAVVGSVSLGFAINLSLATSLTRKLLSTAKRKVANKKISHT